MDSESRVDSQPDKKRKSGWNEAGRLEMFLITTNLELGTLDDAEAATSTEAAQYRMRQEDLTEELLGYKN